MTPAPCTTTIDGVPPDVVPARMLRRFANGRSDPTMRFEGTGVVRATNTAAGPATVRYAPVGRGSIRLDAWGPGADAAMLGAPSALGLLDRPEEFETDHPVVRNLLRHGPVRVGGTHSLVEALVPTILGQKVQTAAAHASYRYLCRRFGAPAPGPFDLVLPPHPERLASLSYESFHPGNVERRRADLIRTVCARHEALDRLALERSAPDVRAALMALPGIGPWTAAVVTLNVCGDPDAVIVGDFHLPNQVAWVLAGEARATDDRMLDLLAPFTGHRARVQLALKRSGRSAPKFGPRLSIRDIRRD